MSNPWSAFYWGDYIADTGHLTLAQHGAYILLMAHYYRTRRPLPANASVLHRVCRCTTDADKSSVDEVLAEFFTLEDGLYRHNRIDRELAKSTDISEKRRAAAQAKHQKGRHANAVQMHTQPQPQPQPQPNPSLLENSFVHSKEKGFTQSDFDARDLRKLAKAREHLELKISNGWGSNLTNEEIWEHQCILAGISVRQGEEVLERAKKRPQVQTLEASA
jgi:uncharacterized protein YdaU (DUF1376 family)